MGRRQWGLLGKHHLMICKIFLLGLAGLALAGEPGVFDNYFDDTIKEVDISLDIAIKGCLQNGDTFADKVRKAYGDCFGSTDYGFGDLAANEGGKDSDNDGLPDKFEGNEKCFYKKIGWVDGAGKLSPDAIKCDLAGLATGEKSEFDDNIDKCANWNGDFSSRRKREVGENETEEEVSNVPSVMESGNSALGWLQAAVRKVRSANPAKNGKKNAEGRGRKKKRGNKPKKGKKNGGGRGQKKKRGNKPSKGKKNDGGRGRKKKRGNKPEKGKKNGGRRGRKKKRNNKPKKNGKKKGSNRQKKQRNNKSKKGKKNGNGERKKKRNNKPNRKGKKNGQGSRKKENKGKKGGSRNNKPKKGGKGKKGGKNGGENTENKKNRNNQGMDDSTYNKLWCFDPSLEQILEKCVE